MVKNIDSMHNPHLDCKTSSYGIDYSRVYITVRTTYNLDLQSGTFTGSGAGLPTPAFFWIWSSCFFPVTLCGFSRLCILCGPHFFEGKPTTDAMILLAKRALLPVPLFSHSTGFSMVHTGSIRSV